MKKRILLQIPLFILASCSPQNPLDNASVAQYRELTASYLFCSSLAGAIVSEDKSPEFIEDTFRYLSMAKTMASYKACGFDLNDAKSFGCRFSKERSAIWAEKYNSNLGRLAVNCPLISDKEFDECKVKSKHYEKYVNPLLAQKLNAIDSYLKRQGVTSGKSGFYKLEFARSCNLDSI